MIEKIWTVQESGLLLRLGRSELMRMEYQSRARSLPSDLPFPFPENAQENAFIVVSGRLLVTYFSDSHRQPIIVELTPGDFFGTTVELVRQRLATRLSLSERSTIVAIPRDVLQNTLNTHQRLQNRVLAFAGWTPHYYSQPLADNFFVPTQKRLARFLYDEATRRSSSENVLIRGLSDRTLSRLLNSAPPLINACLADWERAGIICRHDHHVEIVELSSLAESVRLELREPIHTNGNTVRVVR